MLDAGHGAVDRTVDEPVDNGRFRGQLPHRLWTVLWMPENVEIPSANPLSVLSEAK